MKSNINLLLYFTRKIFGYNLILSLLAGVGVVIVSAIIQRSSFNSLDNIFLLIRRVLLSTIFIALSAGYAFSLLLLFRSRKYEMPLYINNGLRIWHCVAFSYIVHISIGSWLIIILLSIH